jgi:hypothetical protein
MESKREEGKTQLGRERGREGGREGERERVRMRMIDSGDCFRQKRGMWEEEKNARVHAHTRRTGGREREREKGGLQKK